tara:strand:- start:3569 stop:4384 length:816 start_codon:yes stop_codon:yes gene_type:complete
MKVKGFIPLGGYTQKASKTVYEKDPGFDFGLVTGETKVEKQNFDSTGSNGSATFVNYSIRNFINLIGDSEYETLRKLGLINSLIKNFSDLINHQKNWVSNESNIISAFKLNNTAFSIYSFENFLFSDTPQTEKNNSINYYYPQEIVKEIRSIYNTEIDFFRSKIDLTFFLKDSTGVTFGESQKFKKNNIFNKPTNENIEFKINDTTSSTKDGFNINEVINLSFRETFGGNTNDYNLNYNTSNFQAVVDAIFSITSINYNDNKLYNKLTNKS